MVIRCGAERESIMKVVTKQGIINMRSAELYTLERLANIDWPRFRRPCLVCANVYTVVSPLKRCDPCVPAKSKITCFLNRVSLNSLINLLAENKRLDESSTSNCNFLKIEPEGLITRSQVL